MLGPMPSVSQANSPPRVSMLTSVRPAGNGIAQGSMAAPAAGHQIKN